MTGTGYLKLGWLIWLGGRALCTAFFYNHKMIKERNNNAVQNNSIPKHHLIGHCYLCIGILCKGYEKKKRT